jgi:hypothetical protein
MTLPPASDLIALVKSDGAEALDRYAPDVEALASTAEVAEYLGVKPQTIRRERFRPRADGTTWPEPDRRFGRAASWTYRTVILHRAAQPGPGNRKNHPTEGNAQ